MTIKAYQSHLLTNFSLPAHRAAMSQALSLVKSRLGRHYPLLIGGRRVETPEKIASLNPADPAQVVGYVSKADGGHVDAALAAGWEAFARWKQVPGPVRARYLYKAAAIMRRRQFELSAWEVLEAGKSWPEADADVAEAIDFLEYYARQMERLSRPIPLTPLGDEEDEAFYVPLGVGAVIPPWNFPLAILTGMSSAAIVAGNPIVLKPASPTPVMGALFAEIMEEAGLPAGVLNFLPGDGSTIGDHLVGHRLTRFVSFTGSREVGLHINRLAADVAPGQRWIKRVVAEMGGKDAIIVDETADLDAAADGIVASAFGFQGQKCSACSRAIIVDAVYGELMPKILERTARLTIGPVDNPDHVMGPVVDQRAYDKIFSYIEWGKQHARLSAGGHAMEGAGYFIPATIFEDVAPGSKLEQEEIFGPVLSIIRVSDWEAALRVANDTEYGLTGSVYSKNRGRIEQARAELEVGNLYINRKCTGAVVGSHPFGGFNMSGTDSKTGSPDYLLLFLQMKSVAEQF
ncbi:MAG: L-glutamate gamma-semialdehyde dehydrogenase [Thermaerobacter sp.]|nr:L-glutamate gamma-semialdehyde dehydrogenase [Thermaerobacter sp.]